jgi:hypothetical protein
MPYRFLALSIATITVSLMHPEPVRAHDLRVVVNVLPETIQVEAGYDDDTPAEGAKVTITDAQGVVVAQGTTDERGICHLPRLEPGRYNAKVIAAGHADTVAFEIGNSITQFRGWRLNRMLGVAIGAGGLILISVGFWWRLRRKNT